MRTRVGTGAAFLPVCCGDDGLGGPAGRGAVPGGVSGAGAGPAVRFVPNPAGAAEAAASGRHSGLQLLAGGDRRPFPLVPGGLGRPGAAVRHPVFVLGRSALFLGFQPLDVKNRILFCRFSGSYLENCYIPADPAEKFVEKS